MAERQKKKQNESFEVLLQRLEEIVQKMESGNLSLEDTMSLYEEGIGKADLLTVMLTESRKKVMKLVQDKESGLALEPFEQNGGEE